MNRLFVAMLFLAAATYVSCKNENDEPIVSRYGTLSINLKHNVDNQPLVWNDVLYRNDANELYSIDRIQYYLSSFRFYYQGKLQGQIDSVYYFDARNESALQLGFPQLRAGLYDSLTFYIGLDPVMNVTNSLPATLENNAMSWPDAMGGGYHFMKLEGHWKDSMGMQGFAMHLGKNGYQVLAGSKCNIKIEAGKHAVITMTMNINEWFRNPHVYSFGTDGVYSMGNAVLMQKIADNGADVFKVQ